METHRAGRFQVSFPSGAAPRESWAFPESRSGLAREYDSSFIFLRDQETWNPQGGSMLKSPPKALLEAVCRVSGE